MRVLTIILILFCFGCYTPRQPQTIGVMNCKPSKGKAVSKPLWNRLRNPTLKHRF